MMETLCTAVFMIVFFIVFFWALMRITEPELTIDFTEQIAREVSPKKMLHDNWYGAEVARRRSTKTEADARWQRYWQSRQRTDENGEHDGN